MTIKKIKSKIEALDTALRFPALPPTAALKEALTDLLIELQADLINELEATKGGTQFAVRNAQGKAIPQDISPPDSCDECNTTENVSTIQLGEFGHESLCEDCREDLLERV